MARNAILASLRSLLPLYVRCRGGAAREQAESESRPTPTGARSARRSAAARGRLLVAESGQQRIMRRSTGNVSYPLRAAARAVRKQSFDSGRSGPTGNDCFGHGAVCQRGPPRLTVCSQERKLTEVGFEVVDRWANDPAISSGRRRRLPAPSSGSVQPGLSTNVHQRGLRLASARRLITAIRLASRTHRG